MGLTPLRLKNLKKTHFFKRGPQLTIRTPTQIFFFLIKGKGTFSITKKNFYMASNIKKIIGTQSFELLINQ